MSTQLGFYFNSDICVGCKACQIACKDKNQLPVGVIWRRVVDYGGGSWTPSGEIMIPQDIFGYFISISCNHCENPVCMDACPANAISKTDEGIVLIDENKCIGCRYCEWACPYAAPQFDSETGKMGKCDFCVDYIDQDLPPACVAACPMRALDFGELEELRAQYGNIDNVYPLPNPELTKPALVVTPHVQAVRGSTESMRISNMEEI